LARIELARLLQSEGRYAEPETLMNQALAARRATLGARSPAVASSLVDLGLLAQSSEDWAQAEAALREAIPIWREAKIEDQELFAEATLARVLQEVGKLGEADTLLADALARRRRLFGPEHWSVGDTYEKLANGMSKRGRFAEAESLSAIGLDIRRKVYGPRSVQVASQLLTVASIRTARGDTSDAIPLVRESVTLYGTRPPTDVARIGAQITLAIDLCSTGSWVEGDSVAEQVQAYASLDSTRIQVARARAAVGFCLACAKRFAEAEPALLAAERWLRTMAPLGAQFRSNVVAWVISLYEQWGKPAAAAEWRARMPPRL
jgi:tetratricopeptide (TPR) repeat protein